MQQIEINGVKYPVRPEGASLIFAGVREYMVVKQGNGFTTTSTHSPAVVGVLQFYLSSPEGEEQSWFVPAKNIILLTPIERAWVHSYWETGLPNELLWAGIMALRGKPAAKTATRVHGPVWRIE